MDHDSVSCDSGARSDPHGCGPQKCATSAPASNELDHLISLELGGAPADLAKLWPEPWSGQSNGHQKGAVENYRHEEICRNYLRRNS
jgi:hypothetical protein